MFDIVSDLHIDYYENISVKDITFKLFNEKTIQHKNLIIAGDISEDFTLLKRFLIEVSKLYKNVIFVFGNHDFFITNKDKKIGILLSLEKIPKLKEETPKNVHVLDGDIVEIDGKKIGGCSAWYDGSYLFKYLNSYNTKKYSYIEMLWTKYIDFKKTIGFESFNEYWFEQKEKLKYMSDKVDIMVTHFNPSNNKEHSEKTYRYSEENTFFNFNGEPFIKDNIQWWVFGHTHFNIEFKIYKTKFINAYPIWENINNCKFLSIK